MSEVENSLRVLIIDQICIINFSSYFGVFKNIDNSSLFLSSWSHPCYFAKSSVC